MYVRKEILRNPDFGKTAKRAPASSSTAAA